MGSMIFTNSINTFGVNVYIYIYTVSEKYYWHHCNILNISNLSASNKDYWILIKIVFIIVISITKKVFTLIIIVLFSSLESRKLITNYNWCDICYCGDKLTYFVYTYNALSIHITNSFIHQYIPINKNLQNSKK